MSPLQKMLWAKLSLPALCLHLALLTLSTGALLRTSETDAVHVRSRRFRPSSSGKYTPRRSPVSSLMALRHVQLEEAEPAQEAQQLVKTKQSVQQAQSAQQAQSSQQAQSVQQSEAAEQTSSPEAAPAEALNANTPCTPQCTWQCESRKCNQICEPWCQAPRCETRCSLPDFSSCHPQCDTPHCTVACPSGCAASDCNQCKTMCTEPMCFMRCPGMQPCRNVCELPKCDWHCKEPKHCPAPLCKMVCEPPKNCPHTTWHEQLPPKLKNEISVQAFRAPALPLRDTIGSHIMKSATGRGNVQFPEMPEAREPRGEPQGRMTEASMSGAERAQVTEAPAEATEAPVQVTEAPTTTRSSTSAKLVSTERVQREEVLSEDTKEPLPAEEEEVVETSAAPETDAPSAPTATPEPFNSYDMPAIDMPTAEEMKEQGREEVAKNPQAVQRVMLHRLSAQAAGVANRLKNHAGKPASSA